MTVEDAQSAVSAIHAVKGRGRAYPVNSLSKIEPFL